MYAFVAVAMLGGYLVWPGNLQRLRHLTQGSGTALSGASNDEFVKAQALLLRSYKESNLAEAVADNLGAVGIRSKLRPLERAAFLEGYAKKSFKNIIQGGTGAFGNAATRLEATAVKGGVYAYGSDPEIDRLFQEQAAEMDHERREVILQKMQQLLAERTIFAPIWQLAFINGVGPRVAE